MHYLPIQKGYQCVDDRSKIRSFKVNGRVIDFKMSTGTEFGTNEFLSYDQFKKRPKGRTLSNDRRLIVNKTDYRYPAIQNTYILQDNSYREQNTNTLYSR